MIRPLPHIAAMAPYALAEIAVPAGRKLISLAQNESACPPSLRALAAGRDALRSAHLYPDPHWVELRAAVAQIHDIDIDHILCGAGSMELIACLIRCFAAQGDRVLSSQYAYAFFRTATLAAGANYDAAPEHDMTISVDALLDAVRDETRIVCVANPGNPTGTRIPRHGLVRLRDWLRDDILLVIDEAYGEFVDAPGEAMFDLASRGNTVILRTLSKAYALAGMRIGWGVFPPEVAAQVRKLLNPNNISLVSQAAATAAIRDRDYIKRVCHETADRRARFAAEMTRIGLRIPASHTNFVLINFPDRASLAGANEALRARGIIMREMSGYDLPTCLRATIGGADDMDFAASVLSRWARGE